VAGKHLAGCVRVPNINCERLGQLAAGQLIDALSGRACMFEINVGNRQTLCIAETGNIVGGGNSLPASAKKNVGIGHGYAPQ